VKVLLVHGSKSSAAEDRGTKTGLVNSSPLTSYQLMVNATQIDSHKHLDAVYMEYR
jgi:hypothetical protein